MNLISIIILLLPLALAIFAFFYLVKHSQLWLEAFATITTLMLMLYGLIFSLDLKENGLFNLIGVISFIQFFGILLFPITSPEYYQKLHFKSLLFDGQSSFSRLAKHIQNSRSLRSLVIFLFFLASIGLTFFSMGFIDHVSQVLWIVLLSILVTIINAVSWKPNKI